MSIEVNKFIINIIFILILLINIYSFYSDMPLNFKGFNIFFLIITIFIYLLHLYSKIKISNKVILIIIKF